MPNFYEVLTARYSSVSPGNAAALTLTDLVGSPTSTNAKNWANALFCASQLRVFAAQPEIIGAGPNIHALDSKIFVVLDAMTGGGFCATGTLEAVETAIEDLRATAYAAATLKTSFDPANIGSTTIAAGVSVAFSYGAVAGSPYTQAAFSEFRTACRLCYQIGAVGCGGVYDADGGAYTQSLPYP